MFHLTLTACDTKWVRVNLSQVSWKASWFYGFIATGGLLINHVGTSDASTQGAMLKHPVSACGEVTIDH